MFVYMKAGKTLDKKRPKASPYISVLGEQRIMLRADEPVEEKLAQARASWPDRSLGGAINHLKAIVRLYERLVSPLDRSPLPTKVRAIIDRIFD